MDALDIEATRRRLEESGGGYEVVHTSPGLEIGVYVLVAPEPDRQQPHVDDEVYVVLDGRGVLEVEGDTVEVSAGQGGVRAGGSRSPVHGLRRPERPRRLLAPSRKHGGPQRARRIGVTTS